jgi:hypothetical protein
MNDLEIGLPSTGLSDADIGLPVATSIRRTGLSDADIGIAVSPAAPAELKTWSPTMMQRLQEALPSVFGPTQQPVVGGPRGAVPVLSALTESLAKGPPKEVTQAVGKFLVDSPLLSTMRDEPFAFRTHALSAQDVINMGKQPPTQTEQPMSPFQRGAASAISEVLGLASPFNIALGGGLSEIGAIAKAGQVIGATAEAQKAAQLAQGAKAAAETYFFMEGLKGLGQSYETATSGQQLSPEQKGQLAAQTLLSGLMVYAPVAELRASQGIKPTGVKPQMTQLTPLEEYMVRKGRPPGPPAALLPAPEGISLGKMPIRQQGPFVGEVTGPVSIAPTQQPFSQAVITPTREMIEMQLRRPEGQVPEGAIPPRTRAPFETPIIGGKAAPQPFSVNVGQAIAEALGREQLQPPVPVERGTVRAEPAGGQVSFAAPAEGGAIPSARQTAVEQPQPSPAAGRVMSGVDPTEYIKALRPALRLMSGTVVEGKQGQSHNDIIRENNISPDNIDSRVFVKAGDKTPISREEAAKLTQLPTSEPGRLHSSDLAKGQDASAIRSNQGQPSPEGVQIQGREENRGGNLQQAAGAQEAPALPQAGDVGKPDWELYSEELRGNLESFSPARHTGQINYDMMDVADSFVQYAEANAKGRPLTEVVREFAKSAEGTPKQLRQLKASVKSIEDAKFDFSTKPESARLYPQAGDVGKPETMSVGERRSQAYEGFKSRYPESQAVMVNGRLYSPEARQMLQGLQEGKPLDREKFDAVIKRDLPWDTKIETPTQKSLPSKETILNAVTKDKAPRVMTADTIPAGTKITSRQDVPAMRDHGIGVVTVDSPLGKHYEAAFVIDNPELKPTAGMEKAGLRIGAGKEKEPTIVIRGTKAADQSLPKDLDTWTQAGYNPDRHSYMYDRATGEPILSGSKAVQIGNSIFVKDPVHGPASARVYSGIPMLPKEHFDKAIERIKILATGTIDDFKRRGTKQELSMLDNRIGNIANTVATQNANTISGPLKRTFGKQEKLADVALSLVREVGEDKAKLQQQLNDTATKFTGKQPAAERLWKQAAEFALKNFDQLRPLSEQYKAIMDMTQKRQLQEGSNIPYRQNYVEHLFQDEGGLFEPSSGGTGGGAKKARTYDTFFDRIADGNDPVNMTSTVLMKDAIAKAQRQIVQPSLYIKTMSKANDPINGKPVMMPLTEQIPFDPAKPAPAGYTLGKDLLGNKVWERSNMDSITRGPGLPTDVRPPKGYLEVNVRGKKALVQEAYKPLVDALNDTSWFDRSRLGKATTSYAGVAKHVDFLFDVLHLTRMWKVAAGIKRNLFVSPTKGLYTLDYTPGELRAKAAAGEINPADLPELLRRRDINMKLLSEGFNPGRAADALHQHLLDKMWITGPVQHYIFNVFSRGAMAEVGPVVYDRIRAQNPTWTERQVLQQAAKDLNLEFRNVGSEGFFKSKTGNDMMRIFIAAPRWTMGTIARESKALAGFPVGVYKTGKTLVTEGKFRPQFNTHTSSIATVLLGQLIANQIINIATTGHTTFENDDEHKFSADLGNGKWLGLTEGGLEATSRIMDVIEKNSTWLEAGKAFVGPKLSVPARAAATAVTGQEYGLTGPLIPKEEVGKKAIGKLLPDPIIFQTIRKKGIKEAALSALELAGKPEAIANQKTLQAVSRWKQETKIPEREGKFPVSSYAALTKALRDGDTVAAQEEYAKFTTPDEKELADRYYKNYQDHAFTGSAKHEKQYKAYIANKPALKKAYDDAMASNKSVSENFFKLQGKALPKKGKTPTVFL